MFYCRENYPAHTMRTLSDMHRCTPADDEAVG